MDDLCLVIDGTIEAIAEWAPAHVISSRSLPVTELSSEPTLPPTRRGSPERADSR